MPRPTRTVADPTHPGERLQKKLAEIGIGSRRDMEALIEAGRASINGQVVTLGAKVRPGDRVRVDGHEVRISWQAKLPRVLIYHKPEGEIVSRDDPEGRASVFESLPSARGQRWISVGRLDINTEGLLIFTTSGELANHLMHPRYEMEREYAVRVRGELTPAQMKQLTTGVELDDGMAKAESVYLYGGAEEGVNRWYRLVVMEGRNREVRRLIEAMGLEVSRLIRVRFGPVSMPARLKRGQVGELTEPEVAQLLEACGLVKPRPPKPAGRSGGRTSVNRGVSGASSRR
jgi:23S rRNA pseudouridine2605 synthase